MQSTLDRLKHIFFFPFFAKNKVWHNLFEITILVKGVNGIWEIAVGALFLFFQTDNIYSMIMGVSQYGFAADYLERQANDFSLNTQYFIAAYFLFYGVVNLFLMVCLLQKKLWAYPAAIAFFMAFIVYLCYRFYVYRSGLLLCFIAFDMAFVALTYLEHRRIKNRISL